MRLALEITTDNAAFEDAGGNEEVARILRHAANQLLGEAHRGDDIAPGTLRRCYDVNGNKVGHWLFYSA